MSVRLRMDSQLQEKNSVGLPLRNLLGEAKVHGVKRYDEVFIVVDLLKGIDHTWLSTDGPGKVFVGDSVLQAHALLGDGWELVLVYGAEVLAIEAKVAVRRDQSSAIVQASFEMILTSLPTSCTWHLHICRLSHGEWHP
jgi:hypothetical protein